MFRDSMGVGLTGSQDGSPWENEHAGHLVSRGVFHAVLLAHSKGFPRLDASINTRRQHHQAESRRFPLDTVFRGAVTVTTTSRSPCPTAAGGRVSHVPMFL